MSRSRLRAYAGLCLALVLSGAAWWHTGRPLETAQQVAPRVLGLAAPVIPTAQPAVARPSYVVLIVLDGARPDYFSVPNTPHLQALRKHGTWYANAMAGILESETPSGHATIATGSEPNVDGVLSFVWANSANTKIDLFGEQTIREGTMERVMRTSGAPTIASNVHQAMPGARVVALSGYKYYAADALGGPDADAIMYFGNLPNGTFGPTAMPGHMPPQTVLSDPALVSPNRNLKFTTENHLAMALAARAFQTMRQQVTLINLPDSDWPLGHPWGADDDRKDVTLLMQHFDADLGRLEDVYRQAGVLDKTLFIVTADHGFVTIKHKVSATVIRDAVQKAGTSILYDTYHTASYVWIRDESKAAAAAANIVRARNPSIQSVYYRTMTASGPVYVRAGGSRTLTSAALAANQYLLHTFNGPNGPDLVTLFTEGAAGTPTSQSTWKGDHGGADWQSQHVPLLLAGPGVRRDHYSNWPARLEDVAPTLLDLLGASPAGMEGVVLADALRAPTAAQEAAQQTMAAKARPVIAALQQESALEAGG